MHTMNLTMEELAGQGPQCLLDYQPPFDWRAMLAYLATRAIPGVESVSADSYSRTIVIDGQAGEMHVRFLQDRHAVQLRILSLHASYAQQIVARVREMFDLSALSAQVTHFLARDALLARALQDSPGIRVPLAWDGFEVAVRAIIGQQVSVKGATTLVSRVAHTLGSAYVSPTGSTLDRVFPSPAMMAQASLDGLGITTRRIAAINALATAVCDGELRFDGSMSSAEFVAQVVKIPGIGPWTAQYIALRALNDPDAFPHADLILLRAAAAPGESLTPAQLLERSQAWRPWRSYVVMLLWHDYGKQKSVAAARERAAQ